MNKKQSTAFIGGGNMASAILGGLLRAGHPADALIVVDPGDAQRQKLEQAYGVQTFADAAQAAEALAQSTLVVWAIKPQQFKEAASQVRPHLQPQTLHLSVAAGIRSGCIAQWLDSLYVVRAMPNTPALIGRGISGLYARPQVSAEQKQGVETVLRGTGEFLWLALEDELDAVTALSGSGPAYVFYFVEAMVQAGVELGLSAEQAKRLALATFDGATALAQSSDVPPEELRERVTSKGGTTFAALSHMEQMDLKPQFVQAMHAAYRRANELGQELSQ